MIHTVLFLRANLNPYFCGYIIFVCMYKFFLTKVIRLKKYLLVQNYTHNIHKLKPHVFFRKVYHAPYYEYIQHTMQIAKESDSVTNICR